MIGERPRSCRRAGPTGRRSGARFARSEDGVAILEFALIAPILLLMYFGTVELATAVRQARKVDLLARTLGDTFSQRNAPTASEVSDIFEMAPLVMLPFDSSDTQMTVSAVGVIGDAQTGPLQICSSVAAPKSPVRAAGSFAPVDAADSIQVKGTRLLLVEVTATYRPVTGSAFLKSGSTGFTMSRKTLWPIRYGKRFASQSPEVVIANGAPCPPR